MMDYKKIFVPLNGPERFALAQLAKRERRDPRVQAAVLIHEALGRLGLLETSEAGNGE